MRIQLPSTHPWKSSLEVRISQVENHCANKLIRLIKNNIKILTLLQFEKCSLVNVFEKKVRHRMHIFDNKAKIKI